MTVLMPGPTGDVIAGLDSQFAECNVMYLAVLARNALAAVPSEVSKANGTTLKNIRGYLDRLAWTGDLGSGVLAGTVEPERWVKILNQQGSGLNSIVQTLKDEAYTVRLWNEVVVPTATQVSTTVQNAATGAGIGVGVVIALLLLWEFGRAR